MFEITSLTLFWQFQLICSIIIIIINNINVITLHISGSGSGWCVRVTSSQLHCHTLNETHIAELTPDSDHQLPVLIESTPVEIMVSVFTVLLSWLD